MTTQRRYTVGKENLKKYTDAIAFNIKEGKLSQRSLAKELKMSISTINNLAQSNSDPKLSTLLDLADALDLSLDELIGYTVPVRPVAEPTELSPEQVNQMEKSLLQLHSNLSAIGTFQQNEDIDRIIEYTQDCIQQILQGQKLKEEK